MDLLFVYIFWCFGPKILQHHAVLGLVLTIERDNFQLQNQRDLTWILTSGIDAISLFGGQYAQKGLQMLKDQRAGAMGRPVGLPSPHLQSATKYSFDWKLDLEGPYLNKFANRLKQWRRALGVLVGSKQLRHRRMEQSGAQVTCLV